MDAAGEDRTSMRRGLFYGWWIVIASALGMAVSAGVIFHGFGNFVIPLTNEFGWNRTTISSVIAVGRLQTGLLGPLEGWAIDRYGPRRMDVDRRSPAGARLRGDEPHRLPVRVLCSVPADDCGWQRSGPGDSDDRGCDELVQTPARHGLWNGNYIRVYLF